MIHVYHLSERATDTDRCDAMCHADAPERLWADPEKYVAVAEVDTDDLEVAWMLTNSIDDYWGTSSDPRLTVHKPEVREGHRSSCVGDVFLDGEGVAHRVASFGFEPIRTRAREERECL